MSANKGRVTNLLTTPLVKSIALNWDVQVHLSERRMLLVVVDSLIVAAAAWGAASLWTRLAALAPTRTVVERYWYWYPVLLGGWCFLAWLNDLYDVPSSENTSLSVMRVAIAGAVSLVSYAIIHLLLPSTPHPLLFAFYLSLVLPGIALWRWAYAVSFDRPPFLHRLLIVGGGIRGRVLADILREGPGVKCQVMGYVDDEATGEQRMPEGVPCLGPETDLPQLVEDLRIHEIVMAKEHELDSTLFQALVDCQTRGVRVSWMPDLYEKYFRHIPIEYVDPAWALHAVQGRPSLDRLQRFCKRLIDVVLVMLALPFLLVALLPIAVAIRLDSVGPIFYRQVRCGRGSKPFSIFKFRTMFVDAEKDGKARWATENDSRITRVGRLLRKSRLDELPQVINVLMGDMSLIGPRPERPEFVEELEQVVPFYFTRLMVKPGITGWAQVHYDYGNSAKDALIKLQYDFYYIRHWSLPMDLYILYRTVGVVARLKGT